MNNGMNGRELIMLSDMVAKEKGLEQHIVLQALEEGISTSIRKNYPHGADISVTIDPHSNSISAWRRFNIKLNKSEITDYETDILLSEANKEKTDSDIIQDDSFFQKIDFNLTRQQFNITKQVALQKLKTEIKEQILDKIDYDDDVLFTASVKLIKKDSITVELNSLDITIPKSNLLPKDRFKMNDKVLFVIDKVIRNNHSTSIYGSRRSDKFIKALLKEQISYIQKNDVEIVSVSRIPGHSTKVIVKSNSFGIDPVRACIGPKASNVKNISNLINNEFLDFIAWNEEPAQLLINCLQPIQPVKISIQEDTLDVDVVINPSDIPWTQRDTFIQHLKNLTPWNVHFFNVDSWNAKELASNSKTLALFIKALDVDDEISMSLINMGFSSIEELAYTPSEEFDFDSLDQDTVIEIKNRAIDYLKNNILEYSLFNSGLSFDQINLLISYNAISSLSDLSDLDSFELQELLPSLSIEETGKIILKARNLQDENFGIF